MDPASIRYKNPGAMWGGNAISRKWGEVGNVVLKDGQNNHIAIFPTFVHGMCAQIALWRTARYRNKRFAEAIVPWSGGNNVPSYIKLVKSMVPGFTGDTIITDAYLNSPTGILFLKAQAFHEAGRKYPAPDSDWIEAQQRVFGNLKPIKPVMLPLLVLDAQGPAVRVLQKLLGIRVDGIFGPGTLKAVREFQARKNLVVDGRVGPLSWETLTGDLK